MIRVPVEVKLSPIHGCGCFARADIPKGTLIWKFSRIFDHLVMQHTWQRASKEEQAKLWERCYANPNYPSDLVMCGDEAQFLNFPAEGEKANITLCGVIDGQDVLIAACDIKAGEELTVPPESDADYPRKMASFSYPVKEFKKPDEPRGENS